MSGFEKGPKSRKQYCENKPQSSRPVSPRIDYKHLAISTSPPLGGSQVARVRPGGPRLGHISRKSFAETGRRGCRLCVPGE